MTFLVDADSFPAAARAVIIRAAERRGVPAVFIAQKDPGLPKGASVRFIAAPAGPDAADDLLVERALPGDLAFTHDVPLAARLVEKGVLVLSERGTVYTAENIRSRLSERNFMAGLRDSNLIPSLGLGGKGYGPRELQAFSNAFDRELAKLMRP
jgi:uncharacterized protein YaiI (UPF0178 family)